MNLSKEWLTQFFSAVDKENILRRRESTSIEFKEIFDWNDKEFRLKIAKSASAFANNKGGVIIFGVSNKPHKVTGIENFDITDDAEISELFSNYFTPQINFERISFQINGVTLGLMNIHESRQKPIICCKHSPKTFESDIYFRYGARSSKIKSGDLLVMLQEIKVEENNKWFNLLKNASRFGISNVGILNTDSGELIAQNNTFILDEQLVDQIKFIDKYSIEEDGHPAVRIIGEVREFGRIIEKSKSIYDEDVYEAFLTGKLIASGMEYLKAICRFNTKYYPLFFFLKADSIELSNAYDAINRIKSKTAVRRDILSRIEDDSYLLNKSKNYPFAKTTLGQLRLKYYSNILNSENLIVSNENECNAIFQSLFNLKKEEFNIDYLKLELYKIYKDYYPFEKDAINYAFRWSLSYIDSITYRNN